MVGGCDVPAGSDAFGAWSSISCPRCGVAPEEECQREEQRYEGLPHHQRVEKAGGDTMALALEANRRYQQCCKYRRR